MMKWNSTMRTLRGLAALVLVTAVSGCGLVSELQASQMAVGLLLQSPSVPNPSDPSKTIPGVTTFTLAFASVNISQLNSGGSNAATPEDGAIVHLNYHDATANKDMSLTVPGKGGNSGTYALDSTNSMLTLQPNQTYTVSISYSGTTYELQATPPTPVKIKEFENAPAGMATNGVILGWAPNTAFTITRDPSTDSNLAFWDMQTYSPVSNSLSEVDTNRPKTVSDFVNLILPGGDAQYKTPTFTVPAADFHAASSYAIGLASVAAGTQVTADNLGTLFAGSAFFAGAAAGGVVTTN